MKRFFTPAFFRFLLAFSLIILIAFMVLAFAQHGGGLSLDWLTQA